MKSIKVNDTAICKKCLNKLTGATSMQDHTPSEGDISICFYCHTIGRFDSDLNINPLTEIEIDEIKKNDPEFWGVIRYQINLLNF